MRMSLIRIVAVLALVSAAKAQLPAAAAGPVLGVQNFDVSLLCTVNHVKPLPIAGSGDTVYGHTAAGCASQTFGYQFARLSAASLWVEFAPNYDVAGHSEVETLADAILPGKVSSQFRVATLGLRVMVPLQHRISIYGAAGGGGGTFHTFQLIHGPIDFIGDQTTVHGTVDFAGGVDVRLSRRFSIRGEVRDLVTGTGLSGITGRNHVIHSVGASFHF